MHTNNLLAQIDIPTQSTYFNNRNTLPSNLLWRLLTYGIVIAGLYFFVRLLIAGFTFLTGFGEPAKVQAAQTEIAHAFIGLIIVIAAFFLGQIISYIFGIQLRLT